MSESIYNKVIGRSEQLRKFLDKIIRDRRDEIPFCDYPEIDNIDQIEICLEIDQFVKEYPDTYEKYLPDLLKKYEIMKSSKNNYISEFLPEYNEKNRQFILDNRLYS